MIEPGAFYGAVAGASAAIFGVGGGVLATRIVALAERAHSLKLEAGDFLNRSIQRQESLQAGWAEKSRRDALADLHGLASGLRKAVLLPLCSALVLTLAALVPLMGWIDDSLTYRSALLASFGIAVLLWIRILDRLIRDVAKFTKTEAELRAQRRKEMTASGEPFTVSGDPKAMAKAANELVERFGLKKTRAVRKWIKSIGRDHHPRV